MTVKEHWCRLRRDLIKLGVEPSQLKERFILGAGSGGQKVNKTSSCVQLKWNNFEIKCSKSRSRERNRLLAREELCRRIRAARDEHYNAKKQAAERTKRQSRQRSPAQKRRVLDDKKKHSMKKRRRGRIYFLE